jgi:hypothetical protein
VLCLEQMSQMLENAHESKSSPEKIMTWMDPEGLSWTLDINQMIQTCPGQKDRELIRFVSKQMMYIRERTIHIEESRLVEFKAISKSRSPVQDIAALHLIKNFVALLNTIEEGQIGEIYFGVEDNGQILGSLLTEDDHHKLPTAIREQLNCVVRPFLTHQEYEVHMIPVCSKHNLKQAIEHLYVVEVHIKKALHPIYFTSDGQCWARRAGGLNKIFGSQIIALKKAREKQQTFYLPSEEDGDAIEPLKMLSFYEHKQLENIYRIALDVIRKTLREKKEALLQEREEEIMVLTEKLQSVETISKQKFQLLQQAFDPTKLFQS